MLHSGMLYYNLYKSHINGGQARERLLWRYIFQHNDQKSDTLERPFYQLSDDSAL